MNRKFLYRSSIVLFFFACTEDEHISLTNPFDPNNLNIAYKLDLQSNSGANLDSVTISWRQTDVDMKITDTDANEITISGNSYTCCHSPFVGMSPGEFRDFSFSITIDPTTYEDVFQIYSRPVQPVMNFEYNIQPRWETDGRWDEGEEYSDGNGIWDEGEEYIDGNNVYDVGEDYEDSNNGKWDPWEKYEDGNDVYDEGESFIDSYNGNWDPWEVYVDSDNGKWDPWEEYEDGNGIWDEGEEYVDCGLDNRGAPICEYDVAWENTFGDGKWNVGENFTDSNNDNWDPWEEYEDGNGIWDEGEEYVDSNNGKWDPWEDLYDSNNGKWDPWEEYVDGIEVYDRKLEWQVTEEPQDASSKYFIYRVPKENVADLLTPESCDSCLITTLTSFSVASYTDSDSLILTEGEEQTFYYLVQVSTKNGYTRNSFIHYNGFPQPEGTSLNYVSQNKDEYIEIKWTSITESDYFYQYEILRTLGSPEQGNDTLIVAIIPNIEIDHFMDRSEELLGGTTYYYSIVVVDINGRKQHSDFIRGYSNP